ncbi:MAG: hypothetical protein ACKUBY_04420 [Candidatus Moraniibacteriota bacterium]
MRKIIYAVLVICFFVPINSFAELTARQVIEKTWQGRRIVGQENTLWRVQDYEYRDGCDNFLDIEQCYSLKGAEKQFAQSLYFDDSGKDGIWLHFFAPKQVKNKGLVVKLNPDNLSDSSRYFCRGRLARKGARRITTSLAGHSTVDSSINSSWAMTVMQTGIELSSDSFKYEFTEDNTFGFSDVFVVKAVSTGKLPGYTAAIDKEHFSIKGIYFDSYIIENVLVDYVDGKWYPTEIFVWDIKEKGTHLVQDNEDLNFNDWPKSYNKSSLPCGR